jgi:hypothetical protein
MENENGQASAPDSVQSLVDYEEVERRLAEGEAALKATGNTKPGEDLVREEVKGLVIDVTKMAHACSTLRGLLTARDTFGPVTDRKTLRLLIAEMAQGSISVGAPTIAARFPGYDYTVTLTSVQYALDLLHGKIVPLVAGAEAAEDRALLD